MKEVKLGDKKKGNEIFRGNERMELPCLLYVDELVLCGELEENLNVLVGFFLRYEREGV